MEIADEASGYPAAREELAISLLNLCSRQSPPPTLSEVNASLMAGADAWYQDVSGWSSLHYVAAQMETEETVQIVDSLLKGGAIWNLTDEAGYTAGDIAFSLNSKRIYALILDEGIRSEMLGTLLDRIPSDSADENSATKDEPKEEDPATSNAAFLQSQLRYLTSATGQQILVDEQKNGVMMGWETGIMRETAKLLLRSEAGEREDEEVAVLNVGFGLGLIDKAFQELKPTRHVIIEPHPSVLAHMKSQGWYDKSGVEVYEGRWQDYISAIEKGEVEAALFDAVYFDTFSEHYTHLREFFEQVPNLLKDGGKAKFSWFNGMGGSSRLFWDVYTSVAELHLKEIGLTTKWYSVKVDDEGEETWSGIKKVYWMVPGEFRIPISMMEY
ncbi:S-adenosyl-L-methionine-dependent methyltransferase [Atractiella rhizophila]|nr:S-adenosyl-L-methionine-dependent methyltransferase [Atractiella rhizophila]